MGRIAILTGGADAPGMNAVLRSAAAAAGGALGIRGGFAGLLAVRTEPLTPEGTAGLAGAAVSFLGGGECPDMKSPDAAARAAEALRELGADGLVVVGGDGSAAAALALARAGVRVVLVPATVEDDLRGTDACLGVDSAVNALMRHIETLRAADPPDAPPLVVKVPGRLAGHLVLLSAVAAGARGAILPERPFPWDAFAAAVGVSGPPPVLTCGEGAGSGTDLEARLQRIRPGAKPRIVEGGPIARSGTPSYFDRLLGARLGEAAVEALLGGVGGKMIAFRGGRCVPVPLEEVAGRRRQIPPETFEIAKAAGVMFE